MPTGSSAETARVATGARGEYVAATDAAARDFELLRRFRGGEERAFDQLFERYQDYVYNICLGVLADPDDARDVMQETFLRVYRKAGEFRAQAAFSTWLYRVTVNACVAQLRRRPRAATVPLEDESVREIADDSPAAWAGMVRGEDEARVREIVAALPEDYRVVLVLRYFQALSYDEMTRVLGYSLGQVKVKLHRARRAFARKWALDEAGT